MKERRKRASEILNALDEYLRNNANKDYIYLYEFARLKVVIKKGERISTKRGLRGQ